MTVGDYSKGDCGKLELAFCCGGSFFMFGTFALIGAVMQIVEYKSLKDAEMTECFYIDSKKEDCTVTSTIGKSSSTCSGSKPTYFYKVLSHYNMDETNIECSSTNDNDWQVYRNGICICTGDRISEQPYPKYDDNQWHTCYIADCDGNDWSFDSPAKHKQNYQGAFIFFGVLYFLGFFICCLGIYFDNK
eukprot:UN00337